MNVGIILLLLALSGELLGRMLCVAGHLRNWTLMLETNLGLLRVAPCR